MARQKIFFQIFPYFIGLIIILLILSAWHSSGILKNFYISHLYDELEYDARIIGTEASKLLDAGDLPAIQSFCGNFVRFGAKRLTIIDHSGKVLGDSLEDPMKMNDHSDREEIRTALGGGAGKSIRYSPTLSKEMMYVAVPVKVSGKPDSAIRVSVPVKSIDEKLKTIYLKIFFFGLVVSLFATVLSIAISRKISAPFESLKTAAAGYSRGDFSSQLPISDIEEIDELSISLKNMADVIDRRLLEITSERNRQEAILSSMHEGVIAVDSNDSIILMNRAATKLLNVAVPPEGRLFQEIIRNTDIQDFIAEVLSSAQTIEKDMGIFGNENKSINLRGTTLKDANGKTIGVLVVLNDITRLKKLEKIRSEFVANVSHELKTPLTAIRAAVETILDGDFKKDKDLDKLLKIIHKHTDRLSALVEDTLSISELETKPGNTDYKFEDAPIREVIDSALNFCSEKADFKKIGVEVKCDKPFHLKISTVLIEQALVNLIDNAIKYSDEGCGITIEAFEKDHYLVLRVRDSGCGIPREDLPRIFERFYTVDKARSRKLGGTGLGLSIVKHIANVHKGKVDVESEPGKGSTFSFYLPL